MSAEGKSGSLDRREFCKGAAALALGGAATATPVIAGLAVALDPALRGPPSNAPFVLVAPLAAVPDDGTPQKFQVVADRVDAWNRIPNVPVGAVYLRQTAPGKIEAFNALCPHAGGFIDYVPADKCFICPLHKSRFSDDGRVADPRSPSPRPMDSLEVEIRDDAVWVRFENFRAGVAAKIPA